MGRQNINHKGGAFLKKTGGKSKKMCGTPRNTLKEAPLKPPKPGEIYGPKKGFPQKKRPPPMGKKNTNLRTLSFEAQKYGPPFLKSSKRI